MNIDDEMDASWNGSLTDSHFGGDPIDAISVAIDVAARSPIPGLGALSEESVQRHGAFGRTDDLMTRSDVELPPAADAVLLDILPISRVGAGDHENVEIEPDPASMQERDAGARGVAEHLVSWENGSGTVRDAIEHAIRWGSALFDRLSSHHEDILRVAGYDRSDPLVQDSDRAIRSLHDQIQHAEDVLHDLDA